MSARAPIGQSGIKCKTQFSDLFPLMLKKDNIQGKIHVSFPDGATRSLEPQYKNQVRSGIRPSP